jgi:L,D-transpeptidase catalytic domain
MRRAATLLVLALAGPAIGGCGGTGADSVGEGAGHVEPQTTPAAPVRATARRARCRPGAQHALGGPRKAYAALVPDHAVAFRTPGRRPFASFGTRNVNDHATVLGVLGERVGADCEPTWYRVQLPIRPNGVTGWVRARQIDVGVVRTRILVDLSKRRLTLYKDGRSVLTAPVAVGSSSTPTPAGRFYVDQRLLPADAWGPWGPGAIGISAHSDVLRRWVQGGPIAIHGTNEPDSIGRAASHGCIRLENEVLKRVFEQAVAGTPVIISA